MPRTAISLITFAAMAFPAAAAADDPSDAAAKKAVDQFFTALKAKDLDGVMKTVDVPWFHDGRRVLRETKDVRAEFEVLIKSKDLVDLKYEIKQIIPYKEMRGQLDDTTRNLGDEALDKYQDDCVMLLGVKNPKEEKLVLLVRIRKGEAKIVGLQN